MSHDLLVESEQQSPLLDLRWRQSLVFVSIRKGDFMFLIDLDASFQLTIHSHSQLYLWITFGGKVCQFNALFFSLLQLPSSSPE